MQKTFKEIVKERIPPEIIIVIAFIFIMVAGYSLWTMENSGTISVTPPFAGVEIYIDQTRASVSSKELEPLFFSETAGFHEIIVSKENFWPWTQSVTLEKGAMISLSPFLFPKIIRFENIPNFIFLDGESVKNPEYQNTLRFFDNRIISEPIATIIKDASLSDVRYADFLPGRSDVLLVAGGKKIFAIDAYHTHPRNYQPIFEGDEPLFAKNSDGTIFIKDGDALFSLGSLVL